MLDKMPEVFTLQDSSKYWEHTFENFHAKIYLPESKPVADIVNFGFRAPYLLVFEENKQTIEEAKTYADSTGLTKIAADFNSSVVFVYPTCDGGWENATADLYINLACRPINLFFVREVNFHAFLPSAGRAAWPRYICPGCPP